MIVSGCGRISKPRRTCNRQRRFPSNRPCASRQQDSGSPPPGGAPISSSNTLIYFTYPTQKGPSHERNPPCRHDRARAVQRVYREANVRFAELNVWPSRLKRPAGAAATRGVRESGLCPRAPTQRAPCESPNGGIAIQSRIHSLGIHAHKASSSVDPAATSPTTNIEGNFT